MSNKQLQNTPNTAKEPKGDPQNSKETRQLKNALLERTKVLRNVVETFEESIKLKGSISSTRNIEILENTLEEIFGKARELKNQLKDITETLPGAKLNDYYGKKALKLKNKISATREILVGLEQERDNLFDEMLIKIELNANEIEKRNQMIENLQKIDTKKKIEKSTKISIETQKMGKIHEFLEDGINTTLISFSESPETYLTTKRGSGYVLTSKGSVVSSGKPKESNFADLCYHPKHKHWFLYEESLGVLCKKFDNSCLELVVRDMLCYQPGKMMAPCLGFLVLNTQFEGLKVIDGFSSIPQKPAQKGAGRINRLENKTELVLEPPSAAQRYSEVFPKTSTQPIADFKIFGKMRQKVASLSLDAVLTLYRVADHPKPSVVAITHFGLPVLKTRSEQALALTIDDLDRFVFVALSDTRGYPYSTSRVVVAEIRHQEITVVKDLDFESQSIGCLWNLSFSVNLGGCCLVLGVSDDIDGSKLYGLKFWTEDSELELMASKGGLDVEDDEVKKVVPCKSWLYMSGSKGELLKARFSAVGYEDIIEGLKGQDVDEAVSETVNMSREVSMRKKGSSGGVRNPFASSGLSSEKSKGLAKEVKKPPPQIFEPVEDRFGGFGDNVLVSKKESIDLGIFDSVRPDKKIELQNRVLGGGLGVGGLPKPAQSPGNVGLGGGVGIDQKTKNQVNEIVARDRGFLEAPQKAQQTNPAGFQYPSSGLNSKKGLIDEKQIPAQKSLKNQQSGNRDLGGLDINDSNSLANFLNEEFAPLTQNPPKPQNPKNAQKKPPLVPKLKQTISEKQRQADIEEFRRLRDQEKATNLNSDQSLLKALQSRTSNENKPEINFSVSGIMSKLDSDSTANAFNRPVNIADLESRGSGKDSRGGKGGFGVGGGGGFEVGTGLKFESEFSHGGDNFLDELKNLGGNV